MFPILIIIAGIALSVYSYIFMKRNNEIINNKGSFDLVLNNSKDELDEYKMEIGILRKDIGESLTELQQDIIEIRRELNRIKGNTIFNDNIYREQSVSNEETHMAEKAKSIKELLDKNLSEDEISKELSVSKGEVLLVKGLFKQ